MPASSPSACRDHPRQPNATRQVPRELAERRDHTRQSGAARQPGADRSVETGAGLPVNASAIGAARERRGEPQAKAATAA